MTAFVQPAAASPLAGGLRRRLAHTRVFWKPAYASSDHSCQYGRMFARGQEAALGLWKLYWRSLWAYRGAKSVQAEWKAAGKRAFGDGPLGGFGSCIAGGLDGTLPRAL